MMKVKATYKNQFADLKCRWCNDQNEPQQHILTRCPEFKQITQDTTYDTYFQNTNKSYYKAANILGKVYTKIADMTEQNRENTANG
jgi:phage FluMu protein Com